ncbi:HRDC domain-containing protein [Auraticoccus monumenti]|uniref:Ribonuclease D n=1 Tax=Auraticoccus monumenti TaxID=675864 RepID=A0A1G7C6M4_9ACTN|nr:HRDC domain-containing protein [Auraticoccus monumenti]SDE35044.1 ribonuclease D [Auraticoccus monumenti]
MSERPVDGPDLEDTDAADDAVEVPLLTSPADGTPPVVADPEALAATVAALERGTGPVAIDAERAQGYRYGSDAYLIQLRREGSGTHLVDPRAFLVDGRVDLSVLADPIQEEEWIIHAASQDLPCLAEVQMVPTRLFDTELAGRLLNRRRVGLGALIEEEFGVRLLKEHSAADWSQRPMPQEWLTYAALDVELLVELRDRMASALVESGKEAWAEEEFAVLAAEAGAVRPPRQDPWRRTSGIHSVRTPAGLAVVRELWTVRDGIARSTDKAPGRVLIDVAITELAARPDPGEDDLRRIAGFKRRAAQRYREEWSAALARATSLSRSELPAMHLPSDSPPPPRTWAGRDPAAAARWDRVRPAVLELSEANDVPVENLLTPELLRRLAWQPPQPLDETTVDEVLAGLGARRWQRALVVPVLTPLLDDALTDPEVLEQAAELARRPRRRHRPASS